MDDYRPHMLPKVRSKKLMASADGKPCTLRIASFLGLRCGPEATTVAHHIEAGGKGMSTKETDLMAVYACNVCHDIIEGRIKCADRFSAGILQRVICAIRETQAHLVSDGILSVVDGEIVE